MLLVDKLNQLARMNPFILEVSRVLYFKTLARFSDREGYNRREFINRLKQLSHFVTENQMAGGCLTERGEFYIRTRDEVYLYYNFSDDKYTLGDGQALDFMRTQRYDPIEAFLMNHTRDSMVYFDVGANNGYYYSLRIAKRFHSCKIYAFEPDTKILYHLKRNVRYNGCSNITIIPQALTDRVGTARLTADLGASNYIVDNPRHSLPTCRIKCTTLDHFVSQNDIRQIDLIKVDIEGGEHGFARGAEKSIRKFKPIMIMELNDDLLKRNNSSRIQVVSYLRELGFRSYRIRNSNDVLFSPTDKSNVIHEVQGTWLQEISID